ncbi:MAG: DUF4397 domain-containing protein [Candidatus Sumerlaeaceae bacterium]
MRRTQFVLGAAVCGLLRTAGAAESVTVRVIHADPLTTRVAILIDGMPTGKSLALKQSDSFKLSAAQHTLSLTNAETSGALAVEQTITLAANHCYTVVVARETTAAGSAVKPLVVPSECKPPEGEKAHATFVLASPSVEKVDVYAGWFKIISNLKHGEFEGPKAIPAGDYKVVAKDGGKSVLGPIELSPKAGRSYTIVAFDDSNPADGEQLSHRVYEDVFTSTAR